MSDEHEEELTPLEMTLSNGRTMPLTACDCGQCKNQWFVCGLSDDFLPKFCPYCGISFTSHTTGEFNIKPCGFEPEQDPDP